MVNALDQAILSKQTLDVSSISKQDEIPYVFKRKRLSLIINQQQSCTMITKGALEKVLQQCQHIQINDRVVAAVTILLPYTPFQTVFDLQPIDLGLLLILLTITGLYILTTEIVKVWFYKRHRQ